MKLHQILFWFLLLLLPLQLGKHFWPDFTRVLGLQIDYLSPTLYLTDLVVVGIMAAWVGENLKSKIEKVKINVSYFNKYVFLFFSFSVFLFLSSLFAENQSAAIYKLIKLFELVILGLYVSRNFVSRSLALPLSLAVLFSSLLALYQFLKQGSIGGLFWFLGERSFTAGTPGIALVEITDRFLLRPYGTFSHPNSLAGFLLVALILVWGFGQRLPVWLKIIVSFLGILIILLSFSQAVWVVLMVIIAFSILKKLCSSKNNFTFYILLFTLAIISVTFILKTQSLSDISIKERWQLIQASREMIVSSPLWGVGLNNFIVQLPAYLPATSVYLLQPVHNIFLLVASETGLVGLILFLWFILLSAKKALITRNQLLITALVSILLLGLFDHYWLTLQQNMLLSAIAFGLAWVKIKA